MAARTVRSLSAGLALALALGACGDDGTVASSTTAASATGSTECTPSPPDTTPRPVVVIAEDIAAGTAAVDAIASGAVIETTIGDDFRPATAVTSLDQLTGGVAIHDLAANQVVTFQHFGLPVVGGSPDTTGDAGCPT